MSACTSPHQLTPAFTLICTFTLVYLEYSTDGVAGFGYNIDSTPSPSPTPAPGSADTGTGGIETDTTTTLKADNSWWIAAAGGAGVGLGVLAFGSLIFLKFGKKRAGGADMPGNKGAAVASSDPREWMGETKHEPA